MSALRLYQMGATLRFSQAMMWTPGAMESTRLRMSQTRMLRGLLAIGAFSTCAWSFDAHAAEAQFELDLGNYQDLHGDGTYSPSQATGRSSWSTLVADDQGNQVRVTFTAGSQTTNNPTLSYDPSVSGLAVNSPAAWGKQGHTYEIDEWEYLTVNFATVEGQPLSVHIVDAVLVNIYANETRQWGWAIYDEVGGYKVNGTTTTVVGTQTQVPGSQGVYTASINQTASSITFLVPTGPNNGGAGLGSNGWVDSTQDNDFAVRGLSWNKIGGGSGGVPELSGRGAAAPIVLLAGVAFAGLSQRRRRTLVPAR